MTMKLVGSCPRALLSYPVDDHDAEARACFDRLTCDPRMDAVWRDLAHRIDESQYPDWSTMLVDDVVFVFELANRRDPFDLMTDAERQRWLDDTLTLARRLIAQLDSAPRWAFGQRDVVAELLEPALYPPDHSPVSLSQLLERFASDLALGVASSAPVKKPRDAKAWRAYAVSALATQPSARLDLPNAVLAEVLSIAYNDEAIDADFVRRYRAAPTRILPSAP